MSPDTIYALSSGSLPAGIAVVRISGPHVEAAAQALLGKVPDPRQASYVSVRRPDGDELDRGLALFFPGSASATGEPVLELHLHGGRAVVAAVLEALGAVPGLRLAEPGEFTRRAFINGKTDLAAAEGIADLIAAETEAQRRFAAQNAAGAQGQLYVSWRKQLIEARALLEAEFDFADEDDVPGSVADDVWGEIEALKASIDDQIRLARSAEIIRDGYQVVILGPPNAGKSSLLNALARRDVAIVSEEAGTTRDLLEVSLDLAGYKVVLTDTAGIREDAGNVESIGITRALERAKQADLVLMLGRADTAPTKVAAGRHLYVGTMLDIIDEPHDAWDMLISSRTGLGLSDLLDAVAAHVVEAAPERGEVLPSQSRHVQRLKEATLHLGRALSEALPAELRAEELRLSADALGAIIGQTGVEDLLDTIFSRFCIGK